jgi:hypothetical protein
MRITRCVLAGGSSNNVEPYRLGQRVAFSCVSARPPGETNSREDEMEIDRCGCGAMNWRVLVTEYKEFIRRFCRDNKLGEK